jgi:5'-3' exonuclease
MIIHLIDGTYELFRHFYGLRRFNKGEDQPFGAVIGVLQTVLQMIETGATHIGVATDHVIESFRNRMWPGYKTGEGIEPALLAQFHPLEEALAAMGVAVWPMVELEADDALASAAQIAAENESVQKICIWTPDKDLAQCVRGDRVVQVDRRGKKIRNAEGVREKIRCGTCVDSRLSRPRRRYRRWVSWHCGDWSGLGGPAPEPARRYRELSA